eukprot:CAMPEP_0201487912 /NCGR_PEP_ID=MMETSP0151_2-20130828/16328_1 /ASSEMBLY_ACC=CAM_ASM_000257 /TAXON_ID=200890 /ORGANISM="Paramoeba atlantica, Strain 621/1 / CCAP 1560/9" /LENGTH=206 /DNA_ID=CAMNT_0047873087 /DNA_START=139 /DNA_END=759 /DNA_ORIENTATION=-
MSSQMVEELVQQEQEEFHEDEAFLSALEASRQEGQQEEMSPSLSPSPSSVVVQGPSSSFFAEESESDDQVPPPLEEELGDDERLALELQKSFDEELAFSLASNKDQREKINHALDAVEQGQDEEDEEWYVETNSFGVPVSNVDSNGELITKHNPILSGMKNANRISLYVDGSGDMDGTVVSNQAYGALRRKMGPPSKKKAKPCKKF